MRRSPWNLRVACDYEGLTHFGGVLFFHEFLQMLHFRYFLTQNLTSPRRKTTGIVCLFWPSYKPNCAGFGSRRNRVLTVHNRPARLDPTAFLDPRPWELLETTPCRQRSAAAALRPFARHRSHLIFDFDSTVVTVFGYQDGARLGYNHRYRSKRSCYPLLYRGQFRLPLGRGTPLG